MKYQRISTQKLNKIFLCFCEDVTATACAKIVGVSRNTVNSYYNLLREAASTSSASRTSERRGFVANAGAAWKLSFPQRSPKYGIFEISEFHEGKLGKQACVRWEKVFVTVVPDCSRETLMPIMQGLTLSGSTIYTCEVQRLQFRRLCATLEGVRTRNKRVARSFERWRYNHRHDDLLALVKKLYRKTYLV